MTRPERWYLYLTLIGAMVLLEIRIVEAAIRRAEDKYWERR